MISFKLYYEANIANAEVLKGAIEDYLWQQAGGDPDLQPGGPIHRWFTTSFMKFLTGPVAPIVALRYVGLDRHEYKEGEPEWMKKSDVVDYIRGGTDWPKLAHIIHYFKSLSDHDRKKIVKKPYDQVYQEVAQWDKDLAAQERSDTKLKEGTDYEVLYKDGYYTWVELSTKAAYECEGEGMGHCVGGYDPEEENSTIISLWDKKGDPHVTIEIQRYGDSQGPWVSDAHEDIQEIVQIKGKRNEAPVGKYKEITARFVKKWLDEGTFNEQAKSLEELEPSRDVVGDGRGIGMFRWEGDDGRWYWYFEDSKVWKMIYKLHVIPLQQDRIQNVKKRMVDDPSVGLLVNGDANISHGFFKEIPKELANVRGVAGDLIVNSNRLTSLKNSPIDIDGSVFAANNELETLEGGPSTVDGDFKVDRNNLKNLKGLPEQISGDLHINSNPLESLEGAENTVVGGTVFVGGWPIDDARGQPDATKIMAPDFMQRDKVIDAFKHIGKGLGRGKVYPGAWEGGAGHRSDDQGEVQYVSQGVTVYPPPPRPNTRRDDHWNPLEGEAGELADPDLD